MMPEELRERVRQEVIEQERLSRLQKKETGNEIPGSERGRLAKAILTPIVATLFSAYPDAQPYVPIVVDTLVDSVVHALNGIGHDWFDKLESFQTEKTLEEEAKED